MKHLRGVARIPRAFQTPVVTIGNFDGVHLGHQAIITEAIHQAQAHGSESVAFTFRPHPQAALRPDQATELICTYDEKVEILKSTGVDWIIEEPFSREFSSTPPHDFFKKIIIEQLGARRLVVGYDFAFGRGREGSLERLQEWCAQSGIALTVVEPLTLDGAAVSSSKIRGALRLGQVGEAAKLLGRPFFYRGVVTKGDQRGRLLGFPTANQQLYRSQQKLILPYGVYATRSWVKDQVFPSVTNVGVRPTFVARQGTEEPPVLVETHLLDSQIDLYGTVMEVQFLTKIRDEKKIRRDGVAENANCERLRSGAIPSVAKRQSEVYLCKMSTESNR